MNNRPPANKSSRKRHTQPSKIIRKPLLTALLQKAEKFHRVEVKQIDFAPHQQTGLHFHPCPVVGLVTKGTIIFQIKGRKRQLLHPGDAFYEPANATMLHFDAADSPATFVCFYLLAARAKTLITMLDKRKP
jgi:quercetin dioxygenase-like cupin family protein